MGELHRPVGKVFRRLRFQRFVTSLIWTLTVALFLVAATIGTAKGLGKMIPGPEWLPFAIGGGAGVVIAALIACFSGASRLDAAVAIDHRFHLSERLSTALTLPKDLRETPAGTALLADAREKLKDLDVAAAFGPRLPRRSWVVLIPAALAVAMLFAPRWVEKAVQARTEVKKVDVQALTKQTQALAKKISSQRQAIDKEKFPEADKLLAQIEKKAADMAKAPPGKKDQLMIEMNKLTDALKERKKQLGNPDQVNRQLQQLKELGENGPADQIAKELARGDFKKAADQIKQLQDKLRDGKLSQAEKKALEKQLGEMAKKLKDVANMEERKKQLDEALKNGGLSKEQYEREMEKLKEQSKSLQRLQQIASKLGQAQEALQKGDAKQAADSLGMTQQQLADMAKQLEEMEALDNAMAEIQDAKNGMTHDGMNQFGDSMGDMGNNMFGRRMGRGPGGRGQGAGDRPEAPDETATYSTKVQQQIRKGKAVLQGFTQPSKTIKGNSVIDIQAEMEAATESAADALSNQRIPKNVEKHIRAYYDQINKGK